MQPSTAQPFSLEELRDLGHRAATLGERLACAGHGGPVFDLAPWVRAFSPGDPAALERRLRWDGLDPETAARALSAPPPDDEPPAWVHWLERGLEECASAPETIPGSAATSGTGGPLPFQDLWIPFLRPAGTELLRAAGGAAEELEPPVLACLERRLLVEVSAISEQALYETFAAFRHDRWQRGGPADGAWSAFVRTMLLGGAADFFRGYPVLARQVARLIETWVQANSELLRRLVADRDQITQTFAQGVGPGRLAAIETGLSDRHEEGRQVAALTFASGLRLYYKPRDLGLEAALAGWLGRAAARGLTPCPRMPRLLERTGYGWAEAIEQTPATDRESVRRYFQTAGSLVCLAWALGGRDLHMDNLVAADSGPVLIDGEMLLQPEERAATRPGAMDRASELIRQSCLGSGLLSFLQTNPDGSVAEIGGLRGAGGHVASERRRVWHGLNTDNMRPEVETALAPPLRNLLFLQGELQRPEDYLEELADGFARAYRFLLAHRDEILAPEGPLSLAVFAGCTVRVVFRPSATYASLQRLLAAPRYQRSGLERGFALETLHRPFCRLGERPALWPLAVEEREALERLDIPRFTLGAAETVLSARGGTVEGWFVRSGLSAAAARLQGFCAEGLEEQLGLMAATLTTESGHLAGVAAAVPWNGEEGPVPAEELTRRAVEIGEAILRRAVRGDDGSLTWIAPAYLRLGDRADRGVSYYLYDGAVGISLFLAALSAMTGEERWAEAARAACQPLRAVLTSPHVDTLLLREGIGGCNGLGSLVYSLSVISSLLADGEILDLAASAARCITPNRIAADRRLDVEGGAAGAVLGLLALHASRPETWLLERAADCGRHLLITAVPAGAGIAWPDSGGVPQAGFAHGTAGIACALLQLSAATAEASFREAACSARRHEEGLFSPKAGNWPVLPASGESRPVFLNAWCHGAPGIALGQVLTRDLGGGSDALLEAALATTRNGPAAAVDHLCCGSLGRADVLLTAGLVLDRPSLIEAARSLAGAVLRRTASRGGYGLHPGGAAGRVFHPGFFKGLTGIGYQLLRLAEPRRIPSVLGFQTTSVKS